MMAFEYWHSWVKINDYPWLYLNKLWFWCLHSDCMECSGITTHSDICYSLILWNSLTWIDIYTRCNDAVWHHYIHLWYIITSFVFVFNRYILWLDITFWHIIWLNKIQTLWHTLTQYHISTGLLTFLWLIWANNYDYDTLWYT